MTPLTGLPDVLRNIVGSVLITHDCKTWNLFHEENGYITFRIRFAPSEIKGQGQAPILQPVSNASFRRKSEKQMSRDKKRAVKRIRKASSDAQNSSQDIESDRFCESFVSEYNFENEASPVVKDTDSTHSPTIVHSFGKLPSQIDELDVSTENNLLSFGTLKQKSFCTCSFRKTISKTKNFKFYEDGFLCR